MDDQTLVIDSSPDQKDKEDETVIEPKKPRSRGPAGDNRVLFSHFLDLNKKYVAARTGCESTIWLVICKHCNDHYSRIQAKGVAYGSGAFGKLRADEASQPKEIRKTKRDCQSHLDHCKHYKRSSRSSVVFGDHAGREVLATIRTSAPTGGGLATNRAAATGPSWKIPLMSRPP